MKNYFTSNKVKLRRQRAKAITRGEQELCEDPELSVFRLWEKLWGESMTYRPHVHTRATAPAHLIPYLRKDDDS